MRNLLFAGLAACAASPGGAQVPLTLDTSFRASRITHPGLTDALPLEDGSVITNGNCILDSTILSNYGWMKLLPNGDLDDSFPKSRGGGSISVTDNCYYVVGNGGVRRKLLTGEHDGDFHPGNANTPFPGAPSGAYGDVFVQEDGYLLMTGDMLMGDFWGQPAGWYSLMRINSNARLDSTFDHRQADHAIWTLEPLANGQLLASGVFSVYEGDSVGRIIRINQDGTRDTTYHSPIRKGYAKCFIHQPDGKIITGGSFLLESDMDTTHLIRLLPDGALDNTFNNHTEFKRLPYYTIGDFAAAVHDLEQLSDGTIIVAGSFTHIDGQLRRGIALVDSLGNLQNTAFTGQGAGLCHALNSTLLYSGVTAISPAPDGSLFLSGDFWGFDDGVINDPGQRMICKLHGIDVGIAEHGSVGSLSVYPNPGTRMFNLTSDLTGPCIVRVFDMFGKEQLNSPCTMGNCVTDMSPFAPGAYTVILTDKHGTQRTAQWIKH
ncbi:MAG: T9SS type A sorting domain-containing protein [Flavobacteriales bacterium]|nr:T9SS type A sorting domain-containing protein [Flavobacteriales bacterium]